MWVLLPEALSHCSSPENGLLKQDDSGWSERTSECSPVLGDGLHPRVEELVLREHCDLEGAVPH